MRKIYLLLLVGGLFVTITGRGQVSAYTFTAFSGTYTSISGTSPTLTGDGSNPTSDEGYANGIPIGFTFNYDGVNYLSLSVSTNGFVSFGTLDAWWPGNGLSVNGNNGAVIGRPILAPLWDDHDIQSTSNLQYLTSGSAGSRVFVMQWSNVLWQYDAASAVLSFQVRLYEGTNVIQFVYNKHAGTPSFPDGSIGITALATGSGNFLSLNGTGASPTASSTVETSTLSTSPATNQIYQFAPPAVCSGTPTGGTAAASPTTVACANTSISLSVSGATIGVTGLTYQWQSSPDGLSWTDIAGATSQTYAATIGATTYFRRQTICSGNAGNSTSIMVTYTGPSAPVGSGATRCGIGTVNLTATGSPTLNWYATASGGTSLGTGSPFTTPSINTTTTYYVESSTGSSVTVGPVSPTAQGGTIGTQTITWDVNFTTFSSTTLQSVDIFPVASGQSGVIQVLSGTGTGGTVLATINYTTSVSGGLTAQTIPINYTIAAPGNYSLYTSTLPSSGIRRNTTGAVYPYASAVANITGNGFSSSYFMGMYKWVFSSSCPSGRTPVIATVTPAPAITVTPTSNPICLGNSTTITAASSNAGYSYNWAPGGANPLTVSPVTTTQYVVTATDGGSGCVNKDSVTITVNTLAPSAPTVTPASGTICPNGDPIQLTASGSTVSNTMTFGTQANQNTGAVAATDYPAPYTLYYGGQRMQMLVLASELTAAGFSAGSQLTSLQFSVVSRGSNWPSTTTACQNFQVSVGATALTTLSSFQTGLTQVIAPGNFTPVVGYTNTHTFSTPFTWNGTSNIIVETTFSNNVFGTLSDLVVHYNSPTSFQSTIVYRVDNTSAATVATTATVTYSYSARPDFKLNGTKPASNYLWSPVTGLYTNAAATIAYTAGTAATSVYASPLSSTTYTSTASNGCTSGASNNAIITVTPSGSGNGLAAVIGGAQVCTSSTITSNTTKRFFDGSCNLIAKVESTGGASALNGLVNACVKVENGVQIYNSDPYLTRHFDIEPPAVNAYPATTTARITLYVLQSEFNDYNISNLGFPDLPTGPADATGIANIRVTQFHGQAIQPAPGYYPGPAEIIDPADADIVWDATRNWWAISINVTSFSGFYIHSTIYGFPLASSFISFNGRREGNGNLLNWTVATEQHTRGYSVERSYDGIHFSAIGFVTSLAPGGTSNAALHYQFTDNNFTGDKQYYRLKQLAYDGRSANSTVVLIKSVRSSSFMISSVFPNPTQSVVTMMLESPVQDKLDIVVTDISGRVVVRKTAVAEQGTTTIPIDVERLVAGTYFIKAVCASGCEGAVNKFIKQ